MHFKCVARCRWAFSEASFCFTRTAAWPCSYLFNLVPLLSDPYHLHIWTRYGHDILVEVSNTSREYRPLINHLRAHVRPIFQIWPNLHVGNTILTGRSPGCYSSRTSILPATKREHSRLQNHKAWLAGFSANFLQSPNRDKHGRITYPCNASRGRH